MTDQQKGIPMQELYMLFDKHADVFECAHMITSLHGLTHKLAQQDDLSGKDMEAFQALVNAINFMNKLTDNFINELEAKEGHGQIN